MNNYNIDNILENTYQRFPEHDDRPLVGITCNAGGEDFSIRQKYCQQVELAGGVPVLLPPTTDTAVMTSQLDGLDAVIFSGGGDHNPLWQGEEPVPELHNINPVRDTHELLLCRLAFNRQIPMLGICRGMQTMAIALGGHVMQDIAGSRSHTGDTAITAGMSERMMRLAAPLKHSQDAPKDEPTHSVKLTPESTILHSIFSPHSTNDQSSLPTLTNTPSDHSSLPIKGEVPQSGGEGLPKGLHLVNSFHHQAVDNPGPHFRVAAKAPDGIIEAMESTEGKPMVAVQWHPEQMGTNGMPLFKWLCDEAVLFSKAKGIHRRILTIDSHCDTPMLFPQNVNFLSRDSRILYDLHKMNDGRIDAVTMACYLPQPKFGEPWKAPMEQVSPAAYADLIFDNIEAFTDKSSSISIARTPAQVYRDKRQGRHSIMFAIENGLALEHNLKNVERFHQRGIVYITLCHNGDNDICDSAKGCQTHGGLSSFGREVVKEMNRLGIMIDLSHAAESSFYDAIRYSEAPIVCSHSNCRALCDHPRNLTDEQMRALRDCGGVMQLTLYPGFIKSEKAKTEDTLLNMFFRHLDHAIDVMGIDHVGIGTDFDGDGGIPGIADASELINITRHLLRRGFSERDIPKIWGGNWMRVMAEVQAR